VINETCRLITMDVEHLYVNTPINAKLHIAEPLLTISSTETTVQQTTLLLGIILKQYYFQFSNNFSIIKLFPWDPLFRVWQQTFIQW